MGIQGTTTSTTPGQVEIRLELELGISPQQAFDAFTQIGNWWQGGEFQVGRERSINMLLEPGPGGFWQEDWGNGEFHIWAQVVTLSAGSLIRMAIPAGAQWSDPGTVEVEFVQQGAGCLLKLVHRCTQGAGHWDHEAYIPHWQAQVAERFRQYAETGEVEESVSSMAGARAGIQDSQSVDAE